MCLCGLEWQRLAMGVACEEKDARQGDSSEIDGMLFSSGTTSVNLSAPLYVPRLSPLNLAFCWTVTGLAATLHVAGLINFAMKGARWDELSAP